MSSMKKERSSFEELALYGGSPIRKKPWPTYDKGNVIIDDEDTELVLDVIKSRRLFRYDNREIKDTKVGQFEEGLRDYFKSEFALAVSSGTAAISLPLMALDLPNDSLVGCPAYSFTATPSAIIQAKLKPLIIEVDRDLHMDLADLDKKISHMKALIVVHMRGFPAPLPQIMEIANKHCVPIIEDAVPSLGCKLKNKYLGTYGLAGAFSTQSDKSLNTGEGGFILTNDKELYLKCVILSGAYERLYEKHFCNQSCAIDFTMLPIFNFRLDEIRGALGVSQLKKLNKRLDLLSKNYAYAIQGIEHLKYLRPRATWNKAALPLGDNLLLELDGSSEDCCWFAEALTAEGIDAKALGDLNKINVRRFWDWAYLFKGVSKQKIPDLYPNSFRYIASYIDIALSPTLEKEDLDEFLTAIKKVHDHYELKK
ncbi:pyridoxal phosphate-dependent enzyme [Legionella steigerwaltii]|uniref:Cell wall biosynthesis regulatory pyridoxal phosphate-dependent protein n=1 Tax=Legionella steigerwaltii TaxID=460 RepID=A0A378L672_9GAMM|nr:DegT/DnrJ/EryC1/StrS family aminotransferase [Legionella steigerwaltii]KTD76218.1 cell wall biosynthesis regulatory pyridoxal phosphate-dependent protein [Legionella steigerwaltii]STY22303.1 pyridoxal phosphate-dependent enzyme [Legionella steigerwaltii]